MKMNAIKFAELIGFITSKTGIAFPFHQISTISDMIDEGIIPETLPTDVSRGQVSSALINVQEDMLVNRKIDAIEALREICDMSLLEAKNWVERWPSA